MTEAPEKAVAWPLGPHTPRKGCARRGFDTECARGQTPDCLWCRLTAKATSWFSSSVSTPEDSQLNAALYRRDPPKCELLDTNESPTSEHHLHRELRILPATGYKLGIRPDLAITQKGYSSWQTGRKRIG